MEVLKLIQEALINGDQRAVRSIIGDALSHGCGPLSIINEGCEKGMDIVGERFQRGEAYLPELIMAGKAMTTAMEILIPEMKKTNTAPKKYGSVIIGTVQGDLHDIGKNLVQTMISVAGFEVTDLGVDVPYKKIIDEAEARGTNIIATSALLTSTMHYQRELIRYTVDRGTRDKFYFIVGGAPVTAEYCAEIGADGWARTAAGAPILCKQLMENGNSPPLKNPIAINR